VTNHLEKLGVAKVTIAQLWPKQDKIAPIGKKIRAGNVSDGAEKNSVANASGSDTQF
jgi:hypothetical protein